MTARRYCGAGLIVFALLSATDFAMTYALIEGQRGAYEVNPIAAAWLEQYGWHGLAVFKLLGTMVFAIVIVLLVSRRPRVAAAIVTLGCGVLLWLAFYSRQLAAYHG